ncbi:uncharacterized protein STEHIDRAFT_94973 [Stereum hirsutum FP-91666 SS1]|uniref:uncharacterized protein n=1 Tax=Stereum hirsutum (strain FP-91666) TaxID=721885 RepID=UPI000440CD8F|nr:uncharacterized protein STEHIDRAFT_94973 [Stereum hirsutum FP-91666 SS1]EIM88066.1 hypothetical protein STEHIDRAFT_94973 [Stereum hirsutum FP-91666 SS1]
MSATPSSTESPMQPLHRPNGGARVAVPQAPLGNATNGPKNMGPGAGARALLAKRMAKGQNPTYVSPTDNMLTPCTKKLDAAKKKHFTKGTAKPMGNLLSAAKDSAESSDDDDDDDDDAEAAPSSNLPTPAVEPSQNKMDTDDNPF